MGLAGQHMPRRATQTRRPREGAWELLIDHLTDTDTRPTVGVNRTRGPLL